MIEEGEWEGRAVSVPPKPRLAEYAAPHPGPKAEAKGKSMKSILRETSACPDPYALSLPGRNATHTLKAALPGLALSKHVI